MTEAVQDAARLEAEALAARDEAQRILDVSVLCSCYIYFLISNCINEVAIAHTFVSILTFTGAATGQEAVACRGD